MDGVLDQLLMMCERLNIPVPPAPHVHERLEDLPVANSGNQGVYTSVCGNNADLMERIAALYFKPGYRIADVTFGKGVFWRKIDATKYDFHPSDLKTCPGAAFDFRHLPYDDGSFDVEVADPPYSHSRDRHHFEANYRNVETTNGLGHAGIMRLYEASMQEGNRILKPGGLMLVKCQDEIESGRQHRSHIEIYEFAR
jgi:hypothetical protein